MTPGFSVKVREITAIPVPSSQVLQLGNRVEVEGRPQSDGSVLAEKVKLKD